MSKRKSNLSLFFILLIFSGLTLLNSATLPLGEAPDETDHYQYHRFVARAGHPPLTAAEREEAGFKGGLAPLYYWVTAWPIAIIGPDTPPDIRRVDSRPERHIPTDGLGINHVLHTLDEQWPWRSQALAWHWVRLLSLPMGWATIIATVILTRRLLPHSPGAALIAAGFVAFLPRFVISSAVINDDNLVFALTALLLLTQVAILQGDHRRRIFAAAGALFGFALITKYFSLILLPEILFTLWIATRRMPRYKKAGLTAFAAALAATAGPWFMFIALRFNRISELGFIPGLAASLGEPQITEGLVGLLAGQSVRPPAATYSLPEWFSLLYRSFWFEYGWMQVFAPGWVYGLFSVVVVIIIGLIIRRVSESADQRIDAPIKLFLALHVSLFLVVVLARYILSATIDTGQGRHLFPALPVIAVAVSFGFQVSGSRLHIRHSQFIIPTLAIVCYLGAALYTLFPAVIILPRYPTLPVTQTPPADITHRHNLPFADGLRLTGFDVPQTVITGDSLPVTLYWQADKEAAQDYMLTLCLTDDEDQTAACWSGQFVNGRYPAPAWESGDTIIDAIHIPIPACARLGNQQYRLRLAIHPLAPDSPTPLPLDTPALLHTFAKPVITLTGGSPSAPRVELWHGGQRVRPGSQQISLREAVTVIDDTPGEPAPVFTRTADGSTWSPTLTTVLSCAARQSTFIAGPTLPPGDYRLDEFILTFTPRHRIFAPVEPGVTFADTLTPLSLHLPEQSAINLSPSELLPPRLTLPPAASSLPVTIRWQARRRMTDPLVISLKLLDKDYAIGGERVATLGDRYPNVLWAPTEIITETYPVRLIPNAPPGLYRLELSVVHQDERQPDGFEYLPLLDAETNLDYNLYPAVIRVPDPAHGTSPSVPLTAQVGELIQLTGYNVEPPAPNAPLALTLYWHSTAPIPADYTVFTQLLGPDGQVWAQWDNPPQAGRYPTSAWTAADTVIDRYSLSPREGAPPGEYRLLVGMYNPQTGQRLPVTVSGQLQPDNAVELTRLKMMSDE
jgi:4-amino-4-deoxy-L-arabinose transferase-like glycosyltransferase